MGLGSPYILTTTGRLQLSYLPHTVHLFTFGHSASCHVRWQTLPFVQISAFIFSPQAAAFAAQLPSLTVPCANLSLRVGNLNSNPQSVLKHEPRFFGQYMIPAAFQISTIAFLKIFLPKQDETMEEELNSILNQS